jgi:hypothetical protein
MFKMKITKSKPTLTTCVALTTVALAGCADMPWGDSGNSARENVAEIESQRAELARQKEELQRERAQFEAERRAEADRIEAQSDADEVEMRASIGPADGRPGDAKPGECYARVIIPAVYETTNERVLIKEQSERIEIIPARYEVVEEQVVAKPETTRLEVIPAQYETVKQRVEIKPATTRLDIVPAAYEIVDEQVLVKPAITETREVPAVFKTVTETKLVEPQRTEWKLGSEIETSGSVALASASQTIERFSDYKVLDTRIESTGELMCLVEIPAKYETIEKRVIVEPAKTITVEIEPAEYKTVQKTVLTTPETTLEVTIPAEYSMVDVTRLVQPEQTREIMVPAEYRTVSVTRLVEPAQERRVTIPAEYTTVTSSQRVSDEQFDWRPVLCKVNMTRENVSALQKTLTETGCCRCGANRNECKADGIMGPCTLDAAQCFAKSKKLPWGSNYITLDVISELGLKF